MTPDDLDARVAEAVHAIAIAEQAFAPVFNSECAPDGDDVSYHIEPLLNDLPALIRDLHAALKAARGEGEELVLWLMRNEHGEPCHAAVNEHEAWANYEPDEVDEVIADGYTVRRVLCRVVEDGGTSPT